MSCKDEMHLTSEKRCYDCHRWDKDCRRCTEHGCKACHDPYFVVQDLNYCALNPIKSISNLF